jgi:hypothetical protein
MSKKANGQHGHDGTATAAPPEHEAGRLRRVVTSIERGAGDLRRATAETSAEAAGAIDTSGLGREVTRGAARTATAALRHPVATAIGSAYVLGFLKGHGSRRRRSR